MDILDSYEILLDKPDDLASPGHEYPRRIVTVWHGPDGWVGENRFRNDHPESKDTCNYVYGNSREEVIVNLAEVLK